MRVKDSFDNFRENFEILTNRLRRLGKSSIRILLYAIERGEITAQDVAADMGIKLNIARKQLQRLCSYGFLRRVDRGIYAPNVRKLLTALMLLSLEQLKKRNRKRKSS